MVNQAAAQDRHEPNLRRCTVSETNDTPRVRIVLTPEQAVLVKAAVGREAEAIELTVAELEERIAPTAGSTPGGLVSSMLAANSNETLLVE